MHQNYGIYNRYYVSDKICISIQGKTTLTDEVGQTNDPIKQDSLKPDEPHRWEDNLKKMASGYVKMFLLLLPCLLLPLLMYYHK